MVKKTIEIHSKQETEAFGLKLGSLLNEGMCITLSGDLGAGKTTLTKSIGKAIGVNKTINSPTFTILKIYHGKFPLYHIDAYRLEGIEQDLGFDEFIDGDGVCVIDWHDYMANQLPDQRLEITIHNGSDENREFICTALGSKYEEIVEKLI